MNPERVTMFIVIPVGIWLLSGLTKEWWKSFRTKRHYELLLSRKPEELSDSELAHVALYENGFGDLTWNLSNEEVQTAVVRAAQGFGYGRLTPREAAEHIREHFI